MWTAARKEKDFYDLGNRQMPQSLAASLLLAASEFAWCPLKQWSPQVDHQPEPSVLTGWVYSNHKVTESITLDEDSEIWVPVLEPADVHSVDITIRLRFFLLIIIISQAAVKANLGKGAFK